MLFSEANCNWQSLPQWVQFLVRLGYDWPKVASRPRRVALISMPADSAAAALITLGALIRDLGNSNASDLDAHYDALLRFSRQYLERCRLCGTRCHPDIERCGYIAEAKGMVRHKDGGRYQVAEVPPLSSWGESIVCSNEHERRWLLAQYAADWRIDGEPLPQLSHDGLPLLSDTYARIVDGAHIFPENLRHSFSGLCLAGRATGENATREICASIRFRIGDVDRGLPDLLTVHGWTATRTISRVALFNPRTDQLDRRSCTPSLVVSDGDTSFLKVLDRKEFQRSDIIGVIHRTMERDRLQAVGDRMVGLRQWYAEDAELLEQQVTVPRGISISVLRQRAS